MFYIITFVFKIKTIEEIPGTLIPNDVSDIVDLKTDAKFVLLIEKDAIFEKLLDCGAMKNLPACLFVTVIIISYCLF